MKIDEYKNQYLSHIVEVRGRSLNTQKAYDFDLSRFIKYLHSNGVIEAGAITTNIIEAYLLHLKSSTVTKARVRSSIKSFLGFLCRKEVIVSNPSDKLESMKLPEKTPEYLSKDQCRIFLKTIEKESTPYYRERDLMIANLLLKTGLRRAEVVGLNVKDIDLEKHVIRVKRKGNREVEITIHPELTENFQKYFETVKDLANRPLFLSKRGTRLSASSIWHMVKGYSHKSGFNGDVTVHSLRHTFATTLLSNGMSLTYIQALMGHKSSQTTSRYLHFQNSELNEAFNKVTF